MNDDCSNSLSAPDIVVAIGGSAGSLKSIIEIVELLPAWFHGTMVVALHRGVEQPNRLRDVLSHRAQVDVIEPADEDCLECTTIYVGHPGDTVEVEQGAFEITADSSKFARLTRIDDLFTSVAESSGENAVGVILSGMLSDGAEGLKAIHDAGGFCIVQSPDEADFSSMPVAAIEATEIDFIGTTREIASEIMERSIIHTQQ